MIEGTSTVQGGQQRRRKRRTVKSVLLCGVSQKQV